MDRSRCQSNFQIFRVDKPILVRGMIEVNGLIALHSLHCIIYGHMTVLCDSFSHAFQYLFDEVLPSLLSCLAACGRLGHKINRRGQERRTAA